MSAIDWNMVVPRAAYLREAARLLKSTTVEPPTPRSTTSNWAEDAQDFEPKESL